MRYIIRPNDILSTPRRIKEALNAKRTLSIRDAIYRHSRNHLRPASWLHDFFMGYPPHGSVKHADDRFQILERFARSSKADQRFLLSNSSIPIPHTHLHRTNSDIQRCSNSNSRSEGVQYIVRPHRHRSGNGWRITNDIDDFDPTKEYIQELYPKTHEYRIIFVFGSPLITLYKRVPEDMPVDQPWNHSMGSSFVTVTDWNNNRLRHFDIYDRLKEFEVVKHAHIVAADIMYASKQNGCVVSELNFCPSITINENLQKVAAHVQDQVARQ